MSLSGIFVWKSGQVPYKYVVKKKKFLAPQKLYEKCFKIWSSVNLQR